MSANSSHLQRRRIRAPEGHGERLHIPTPSEWELLWNNNWQKLSNLDSASDDIGQLHSKGRIELIELAKQYTRQYRDFDFDNRDANRIVMSGHQPTLFHPGVWYKNFVLSNLGKRFNAFAINLVVDNDICTTTSVSLPVRTNKSEFTIGRVFFDTNRKIIPYELRSIEDRGQFQRFASELKSAIKPFVDNPIIDKLWPYVLGNQESNLAIARGRHQLEADLNLQTLELPISLLSTTRVFAKFVIELLSRLPEFHQTYNSVVDEYRINHRIKNSQHPVPNLGQQDGWLETPFWTWSAERPNRTSLYAKQKKESIAISDLNGFKLQFPLNPDDAADQFQQISTVAIRPKALMTTLFSRLIASDMFIHGIGGSKYDQLTDEIAIRHFQKELPHYLTTTATFRIQNQIKPIQNSSISSREHQLREMVYHPEKFIAADDPNLQTLITEKHNWIQQQPALGQGLQRHKAIAQINKQLQIAVENQATRLKTEIENLKSNFQNAQIANSREYSFCLFDESLLADLAQSPS